MEISEELARLQIGMPNTSWVRPENFHITLAFLGDLSESIVDQLMIDLQKIDYPVFELLFSSVKHFSTNSKSIPIYSSVLYSDILLGLKREIDKVLRKNKIESEKNYEPHITLGRAKTWNLEKWNQYFETFHSFQSSTFVVSEFGFIQSTLSEKGSQYETLVSFPLR